MAATSLQIQNTTVSSTIVIQGESLAPSQSFTWTGSGIPPVCTDVNFRIALIQGQISVYLNGMLLTASNDIIMDLVRDIAAGYVVLLTS